MVVADALTRLGLTSDATFADVVGAIQQIPYGRPTIRSAEGLLDDWSGTCSTKHELLYKITRERWPELRPEVVHCVYVATSEQVRERFGNSCASTIPAAGLTDVHRYMTILIDGRRTIIDATFPGTAWDGSTDMVLACAAGDAHVVTTDMDAEKAALESQYCDPAVREPFIASLSDSEPRPRVHGS